MNEKIEMLKAQAKELRKIALTMIYEAQSGHPGGAFSAADIKIYIGKQLIVIEPLG